MQGVDDHDVQETEQEYECHIGFRTSYGLGAWKGRC